MTLVEELTKIRDAAGDLTPEIVVAAAREQSHPLHHRFEWDDTVAGEQYRLIQAGTLLRVTYRPLADNPTDLRAFVAVKGTESPRSSYVPSPEALADPFTRQLVLRTMEREWKAMRARYSGMAEWATLIAEEAKQHAG